MQRVERFLESNATEGSKRSPLSDFIPLYYGSEDCAPGHESSGFRNYWMIHYIRSGHGILEYRGEKYPLGAGEIFIVSPGEWHRYVADAHDPWFYTWICFTGTRAADFTAMPPIHAYPSDTFRRILRSSEYGDAAAEYAAGCLFEILSYLLREERTKDGGYAERARRMVDTLYMLPITVGSIAEQLSLDRRYLPRLFRARYGMTLQEYLIRVRMESAAQYIMEGYNAEEAGRLSGYAEPVNFYRMFKRYFGEGPAAYRRHTMAPELSAKDEKSKFTN